MASDSTTRLPAEWEPYQGVLIAWPHEDTDWAPILDRVNECYTRMAREIASRAHLLIVTPQPRHVLDIVKSYPADALNNISIIELPTNDTWTRDYGPISTVNALGQPIINDFKFNGWGLKFAADRDNLVNSAIFSQSPSYRNHLSFVLEGGSIESDGRGTLLTTTRCLLSPNRNGGMSKDEIRHYLGSALGAEKILWLDYGALEGDDTDSHIDTLARLAPDNTILYVKCDDSDDSHYDELNRMERQLATFTDIDNNPYRLLPLPMPRATYSSDGDRLPATYANYLVMPEAVLVPTYGQPDLDGAALSTIALAYPGREAVGIDCQALIEQHGSLHCATMQLLNINQ